MALIFLAMAGDNADVRGAVEALHILERKVLPMIKDGMIVTSIVKESRLKEVEVMRAVQWLENKKMILTTAATKNTISIDKNGGEYLEKGLPERRFLGAIKEKGLSLEEIQKKAGLSREELDVCIGVLKGKVAIAMNKQEVIITEQGKNILSKQSLEESLLKRISEENIEMGSLTPEERFAYSNLKKRKDIVREIVEKIITVNLTGFGKDVKASLGKEKYDFADSLTAEMLKSGSWKNRKFRRYDIKINVPKISGGRRHFVNQATDYIKRVWLDMGFKEMQGPMLNTSFWNFDALFTAQDHPVRDLQDTFYIRNPEKGRLPAGKVVENVKNMHEHGGKIGSRGWGYKWSHEEAKRNVLRTHTTVLSARTIASLKESDLPAKFFSVGKCFRNEAVDWSHLFELTQVEGIVVDPNANFKHLIGYLKEFFKKLGYEKVRVRPAYFPYTEPSAEVEVFHPARKEWVELAGSGIFRPEVVVPLLGKDVPVLAWGMGLERSIAEYFKITDIRQLYNNDLRLLREMKIWRG